MPAAVQGEREGIELSHLVHSLPTDQKTPDMCTRRMESTRTGHVSPTLSEPAAGKSGVSCQAPPSNRGELNLWSKGTR